MKLNESYTTLQQPTRVKEGERRKLLKQQLERLQQEGK